MNNSDNVYMQFEALYDKYADMLYRLALANVQNTYDAEDIVHDVFIKYYERGTVFADEEHREGWLVKVTVNACRDFLRKRSYRNHEDIDNIHHLKSEEHEQTDIMHILSRVPERYRAVLVLHYLEDYSVSQVSKMLGLSQSAVKMRLSRGRDIFRKISEGEESV